MSTKQRWVYHGFFPVKGEKKGHGFFTGDSMRYYGDNRSLRNLTVGGRYEVEVDESDSIGSTFAWDGYDVEESERAALKTASDARHAEWQARRDEKARRNHDILAEHLTPLRAAYVKMTPLGKRAFEARVLEALRKKVK